MLHWGGLARQQQSLKNVVHVAIDDLVEATALDAIIAGYRWSRVGHCDLHLDRDLDVSRDEVPDPLDFALTFRGVEAYTLDDQLFNLTLNVVANDTTLLDSLDIIVVVPGSTL